METEPGQVSGFNWRNAAIYAFIPAIIAGVFTVAPAIYQELAKPKSSITYEVFSGPELVTAGKRQRIFAIGIRNAGRTRLTNVRANVQSTEGTITTLGSSLTTGLNGSQRVNGTQAELQITAMLPRDRAQLSLLMSSVSPIATPQVSVRSDDVLGDRVTSRVESIARPTNYRAGLLAFLGVAVSMLAVILQIRRGQNRAFLTSSPFSFIEEQSYQTKADILAYLSVLTKSPDLVAVFADKSQNLSYSRFSDLVVYHALFKHEENRVRYLIVLKSLLLNPALSERSREMIKDNISKLGSINKDDDNWYEMNQMDSLSELDFRRAVQDLFAQYGIPAF